ncbi:PDZ domain-containing protein [Pradoshia sp. D12]|uniref:S1C family serine protease n=1 Tax=Bacillaceae TaxID=186817 RepID=UPI00080ACE36|nr:MULTISPECIES: trypsin-like peptidase domain-containing protein [Bacillaceae]OCA81185.1 serine protease [Bacillus sp. FJAT-27986]QFK73118.1 PDZ domain-containing protein [Pradoshia sp. D12]TPF72111.1 PDZ domain-containing protein [Bacillus sp. D12]
MGYYDQDYNQSEQQQTKRKGSKAGYFLSGLIGAIIGALLVLLLTGNLNNNGLNQNTSTNNGNDASKLTQNVSMDVTTDVTKAVEKTGDAVIGITNIQGSDFFNETQEAGTGSGVIYKKENGKAFIVTNNHVVEGASSLEVTLADGTKTKAELLGSDIWTDLAVIQIDDKGIDVVAEFGNSDKLKAGEPVIAIGNPLGLNFSGSVTQGIISGLNRTIPIDVNSDGVEDWNAEVIQTDAAINPGNSGGALINIGGQVIGINSMKIAESSVEGIGLSIPSNYAIPIIEDLEAHGKVKRAYMGTSLRSLNEVTNYQRQETLKLPTGVTEGVVITSIEPGSPAAKAGLKEFDVIVELDGKKIANVPELRKHLYVNKQIGDKMKVTYYRNGQKASTEMTLIEAQM